MAGTLPAPRRELRDLPLARRRLDEDPHRVPGPAQVRRLEADAVGAIALAHAAVDQPHEPLAAAQLDLHPGLLAQPVGDDERAPGAAAEVAAAELEGGQRRARVG